MNFKKTFLTGALILTNLISSANSGIIYYSEQESSKTTIKQNINLEEISQEIKLKYPKKQLEYSSRGFLQFKNFEFIKDDEINERIQENYGEKESTIDGINFKNDYCMMIDSNLHHLGDGEKDWFTIPKPEGITYEKKFILRDIKNMSNPKLGIESIFSDGNNAIYINGYKIGEVPKISKKRWGKLIKKDKKNIPFLYGESDISKYLQEGENTIRIESEKPKGFFRSHDDFMIRRIQIVYSRNGGNEKK